MDQTIAFAGIHKRKCLWLPISKFRMQATCLMSILYWPCQALYAVSVW